MSVDGSVPFTPYVPRLLIEWLRADPSAPFREVDGTVAFVDISGFTKMCERLARKGKVGAEEVNDVLDASFTQLLSIAYDDGGGVVKWGGDAVLLLFTGAGHAPRACRTAYRMRGRLREIGRRLRTSAGLVSLRMSVGIHSGRFQFFLVGGLHRELIITGPAATECVRLETAASAGEILLGPATASRIDPRFLGAARGAARFLRSEPTGFAFGRAQPVEGTVGLDLASCIPVNVREYLQQGGGEPEHRHVAIAFLEFGGTEALLERAGPDGLWNALDQLMRRVQEAVHEHGVSFHETDVSSDGGKVLLVAGAPKSTGDDEERLLRAARSVIEGDHQLSVRIGLNNGYVFAGDFGPPYRRTYSIKGDAVNLAARVMSRAAPGQILATGSILERSRTTFAVRPLEPFSVKGKKHPVHAFDVGPAVGVRAARGRRELPLVGRDRELRILRASLEGAQSGGGQVIDIVGEPGIGKSRLLRELQARAEGFSVLSAVCDPYESSTPYHPFRSILREVVGIPADASGPAAGGVLGDVVGAALPHLTPWLPLLAVPMSAEVPGTPESEQLDLEFRKARSEQVTAELLSSMLDSPTLLVFEDVHWMDEPSSRLLERLTSLAASRPWLICVTRREQFTGFIPSAGPATVQLRPSPLTGRDAAALGTAASEDAPIPPHALAVLAERSGGNPLFLEELIAAVLATGSMEALPESVEALLSAQIDRLPVSDRTLLRYASVLGASFDQRLLDAALGSDGAVDTGAWDRLAEFLRRDEGGVYRFRHALIRDVAYEGLPYRRRHAVHARVGETIERWAGADAHEHSELLSLHFFHAGRYERAWHYSRLAGEQARAKFANVEAADFFIRALESARRLGEVSRTETVRVLEALGDVSERGGLYKQAAAAFREARRQVEDDPVKKAGLLLKEGLIRERAGRYSDAVAWYRRGLGVLGTGWLSGEALAVRARISVWYASSRQRGRYAECIRWCHRAIEDATASGEREVLAHAYRLLDRVYTNLGRPESAQYRHLALPIYEELGDLAGQSEVLNELGIDAYFEGRWGEALDLYRRSTEARRKTGDEVNAAHGTNNVAEILSDQGHLEEAEALFREVLRVWRAAGFTLGIAFATSNLGRVAARAGRHDEADRLYEEALAGFRAKQAEAEASETRARMAENALFAGEADRALDIAWKALERVEALGELPVLRAMLHRLRGYAMIGGDPTSARQAFDESLAWGRSVNAGYEVALSLLAQADLAMSLGDPEARLLQDEAWGRLEALGVVTAPRPPGLVAVRG